MSHLGQRFIGRLRDSFLTALIYSFFYHLTVYLYIFWQETRNHFETHGISNRSAGTIYHPSAPVLPLYLQ